MTSLGTFTLRDDRLEFFGMSEKRLSAAIALVARRLGKLADAPERRVRTVDEALPSARAERDANCGPRSPRGGPIDDDSSLVPDARVREFSYRRWLDDPNERLAPFSALARSYGPGFGL